MTFLSGVETGRQTPSKKFIEKMIELLDPLPCQRVSCEGRSACDKCTVATFSEGLEFHLEGHKPPSFVFDLDITDLMNKLGLSPSQQQEARTRIIRNSLEICLEVVSEPVNQSHSES